MSEHQECPSCHKSTLFYIDRNGSIYTVICSECGWTKKIPEPFSLTE